MFLRLLHFYILFILISTPLLAQNTGINVMNPTAKLHIEGEVLLNEVINNDFEAQQISPFTTSGIEPWYIEMPGYNSDFRIRSGKIDQDETSSLTLSFSIPNHTTGIMSYYLFSSLATTDSLFIFDNTIPIDTLAGGQPWQLHDYDMNSGTHTIDWILRKKSLATSNISFMAMDNFVVNHLDNFVLRIVDGNEAKDKVLISDANGNALWKTLTYTEIVDGDQDTKVFVNAPGGDDFIQMDVNGSAALKVEENANGDPVFQFASGASPGNLFLGYNSGLNNTSSANTFIGSSAGSINVNGGANTMVGYFAGNRNEAGGFNTFIGSESGRNNGNGYNNTFVGHKSATANTFGYDNTFIGYQSGFKNATGKENTAVGSVALYQNIGASYNTAIGRRAAVNNLVDSTTALGYRAGFSNTIGTGNTFVGSEAGSTNSSGNDNIYLGKDAGRTNSLGNGNVLLGYASGRQLTRSDSSVIIGYHAGSGLTNAESNKNVFVGANAGKNLTPNPMGIAKGDDNVFVGYTSGVHNTVGFKNTFIGSRSGIQNTDGQSNIFIGYNSGLANTNSSGTIAIGVNSYGSISLPCENCTFLGTSTKATTMPIGGLSNSTAIGFDAQFFSANQIVLGNTSVTQIGGYAEYNSLSDGRFKRNISDNVAGLAFINALNPVSYSIDYPYLSKYLRETKPNYAKIQERSQVRTSGLIAQELLAVINEMGIDLDAVTVPENEQGLYGIKYSTLIIPLIQAVQELSDEVERLKQELESKK